MNGRACGAIRDPPDRPAGVRGGNCKDCHDGPLQTDYLFPQQRLDATFTDLGLGSRPGGPPTTDNGKFRVPSLRNIGPYMHDGPAPLALDVLSHYNEHIAMVSSGRPADTRRPQREARR
jgi:cytochrome c peroxidase